jgi:hypothetical protein
MKFDSMWKVVTLAAIAAIGSLRGDSTGVNIPKPAPGIRGQRMMGGLDNTQEVRLEADFLGCRSDFPVGFMYGRRFPVSQPSEQGRLKTWPPSFA